MTNHDDALQQAFERRTADIRAMLDWLGCEVERLESEMREDPGADVLATAGRMRARVKALLAHFGPANEVEIEEALADLRA